MDKRGKTPDSQKKIPGQSMWDLWWIQWHWDRFSPEYFGFPLPVSFNRCLLHGKTNKLIIFITGVHNKPQGCGASVASAAGILHKKKTTCWYFQWKLSAFSVGLERYLEKLFLHETLVSKG